MQVVRFFAFARLYVSKLAFNAVLLYCHTRTFLSWIKCNSMNHNFNLRQHCLKRSQGYIEDWQRLHCFMQKPTRTLRGKNPSIWVLALLSQLVCILLCRSSPKNNVASNSLESICISMRIGSWWRLHTCPRIFYHKTIEQIKWHA